MCEPVITLTPMTREMFHRYFREYENDPELYLDKSKCIPYTYTPEATDRYVQRQIDKGRINLAVMHGEEIIGEIVLKEIEPHRCATIGMCMKNDACKNRGYGVQALRLAIRYVFETLDIPTLYADALVTNARSQHVMEKVGFAFTHADETFRYYRIDKPIAVSARL